MNLHKAVMLKEVAAYMINQSVWTRTIYSTGWSYNTNHHNTNLSQYENPKPHMIGLNINISGSGNGTDLSLTTCFPNQYHSSYAPDSFTHQSWTIHNLSNWKCH